MKQTNRLKRLVQVLLTVFLLALGMAVPCFAEGAESDQPEQLTPGIFALNQTMDKVTIQVQNEKGEKLTPAEGPVTDEKGQKSDTEALYSNAARFHVSYSAAEKGAEYLVALVKDDEWSTQGIYYINQMTAEDTSVEFDVFPRTLTAGEYALVLTEGTEGTQNLNVSNPVATFRYSDGKGKEPTVPGDVTGDKQVTEDDVAKLNASVAGQEALTDEEKQSGDVTGDQDVDMSDVVKVHQFVANKRVELTVPDEPDTSVLDSDLNIRVDNASAKPGESVTIPVTLSGDSGAAGMALEFTLPEEVTLTSVEAGEALKDGIFTQYGNAVTWYSAENMAQKGTILKLTVTAPQKPGEYTIQAALKDDKPGNFTDEEIRNVGVVFASGNLTVAEGTKEDIAQCEVKLTETKYVYDGTEKLPAVTVKSGDKTLVEGEDYELSYQNNVNVGTATVTITGTGNYTGSKKLSFEIAEGGTQPEPHVHTYGEPEWKWSQDYTSASATFTCIDGDDTRTVDANVSKESVSADNDNGSETVYTATVNFNGKSYTDTKTEADSKPEKENNAITASNAVKGYSTKKQSVKLNAKAKDGAKLSYKSNNKKVKVDKNGKVAIPAKFSGTVKITITAAETTQYKKTTKTITVTVPTVTNVKKASAGKSQMTVQWKKNTTGKGYEVQYTTDKKFKKGVKTVKIKKNGTVKTTVKKLKKGTWYVRIRTVNGKSYSDWSKAKSVKIKK